MFKYAAIFLMVFALFSGHGICSDTISDEEEAVLAAENWVRLIDDGQYGESWEEASGYFKGVVKKEAWVKSIQPLRGPLGGVLMRKLKQYDLVTTLPGAPDGEYVVVQFETSFTNKEAAIETVTPMVDSDGVWRVSGYYIKETKGWG